MTLVEANKIIDRLIYGCNWHRFNEPGVQQEYQRVLMRYGYAQMDNAVDRLLESDSKNVPPMSALVKACKENKQSTTEAHNDEYCYICNDKGYLFMTEKTPKYDNMPAQYALHCICPMGISQAYEGMNCKPEDRRPYRVPSVTEYFDEQAIEDMKKENRKKVHMADEQIEAARDRLATIGVRMPYVDHGDAWEGEAPC